MALAGYLTALYLQASEMPWKKIKVHTELRAFDAPDLRNIQRCCRQREVQALARSVSSMSFCCKLRVVLLAWGGWVQTKLADHAGCCLLWNDNEQTEGLVACGRAGRWGEGVPGHPYGRQPCTALPALTERWGRHARPPVPDGAWGGGGQRHGGVVGVEKQRGV